MSEPTTPKPMQGTWTLTAPDGRTWQADSPLLALRAEQRERVPADVALARVMAMVNEPDFAERHVQLGKFYDAKNTDELIDKMEGHLVKLLQSKFAATSPPFSFAPQRVREG
jgi:hypothetical protein